MTDGEWNVDTLKQYVDTRFDAMREAIGKADTVGEQRATKLETATAARFESVNEFRAQTKDLQAGYMPRSEFDAAIKSVNEKISGKNLQIVVSMAVAIVAILIAVYGFASAHAG